MSTIKSRPVYLNLFRIRQPVTAVLSILHRITGVIMTLLLPLFVYLLALSLSSETGFESASVMLSSSIAKVLLVLLSWVFAHHLFAGIRFLLLDFDVGLHKPAVTYTAWLVHALAILSAIIMAGVLF